MALSANFNTLSNIIFPDKEGTFCALEIHTMSARLNYSTPLIQSEILKITNDSG